MKVILQKDVEHLGQIGQIVRVKDGFGRNYLIPRGMAVVADERNVRRLNHQTRIAQAKAKKELGVAQELAQKILDTQVSVTREAGEDDKLFGAVTKRDIADGLKELGVEVDRRRIQLAEPIKSLGRFEVEISLDRGVKAMVIVFVQR
jgi:large subunit ribosomal protein L9